MKPTLHEKHTLGLASASDIHALSHCPGKRILIRSLRDKDLLQEIPSPEATLGERIHSALEGETEDLERKAEEIRASCEDLMALASATFFGPDGYEETLYEERIWYTIDGTPLFSGRPDRANKTKFELLNGNFKTGRAEEEDADLNLQLRCEVVLFKFRYPELTRIGTVIIQPMVTRKPVIALYDERDMFEALKQILGIVDRSNWDPTRHAGSWCKYCAARAFCPEASELALSYPVTIHVNALPEGLEAAEILERVYTAEKILKAVKLAYKKKLIDDPQAVPGWCISKGSKMTRWNDIPAVADLLSDQIDLREVIDIPFTKLKDALSVAWGIKGAALSRRFEQTFKDYMTVTRSEGSLRRTPKSEMQQLTDHE